MLIGHIAPTVDCRANDTASSLVARVVGDLVPAGTTSGYTDTNADCAQDIQTGRIAPVDKVRHQGKIKRV
ncbi:MAG: hypothetical protein IPP57_17895 [Candidatus Obscuribacter sp.]|nr:hypothetical protein [Candidatus Obscuribacter sp.]